VAALDVDPKQALTSILRVIFERATPCLRDHRESLREAVIGDCLDAIVGGKGDLIEKSSWSTIRPIPPRR